MSGLMIGDRSSRAVEGAGVEPRRHSDPAAWRARYAAVVLAADLVAVLGAGLVAVAARFGDLQAAAADQRALSYWVLCVMVAPAWVTILALGGAYDRRHLGAGAEEYRAVVASGLRLFLVVAAAAFILKFDLARGFTAVAIPLAALLTLAGRYALRRWLHRRRSRGAFLTNLLVVGPPGRVEQLVAELESVAHAGLVVRGVCEPGGPDPVARVLDEVRRVDAGAVAVLDPGTFSFSSAALEKLAAALERTGADLWVDPAIGQVAGPRVATWEVEEVPLLRVHQPELAGARRVVKAVVDRMAAALLLVALSPLIALVGLTVRLTSPGPAFFRQVRVGVRGRPFVLWKFRTMTVDAEERLDHVRDLNESDGLLFKIRHDPRVTPVGRHLRRWSLDEVPQLWNVLRGDMSLVGPRPPLPEEVEKYCDRARRRLLVKPGITGLWQVSGRAELSWAESLRLDLYYVENWRPSLDATILAKTLTAVLRRRGAY